MNGKIPKVDKRVQFDLLPERVAEFDRIVALCDLKTRKELFDNAVTLFEWALEERLKGNEIASYNREGDHVEIVRFLILDTAAKRARAQKTVELVATDGAPVRATKVHRSARPSIVTG